MQSSNTAGLVLMECLGLITYEFGSAYMRLILREFQRIAGYVHVGTIDTLATNSRACLLTASP